MPVLVGYAALVIASGLFSRFPAELPAARPRRWRGGGLAAVAFTLGLFCLLQALPLPLRWLEALAAHNADIWARSLKPFALPPPELASVSLAPGRTLIEALKVASYGVVFAVSARLSREQGLRRMMMLAFASALALAMVTAAHQLLGAERLYGQYLPLNAYSVAPLLNPNNRAGYLNLGFFCGLGLLFRSDSRPYLGLVGLGLCFIAAEVLLCRSLGGTACLAIGWAGVVLLALPSAVRSRRGGAGLGPLARASILTSIGLGAVLLALAGQGSGTFGLDAHSWQKVELWRRGATLASQHFGLGIGRGAFASVFSAYQEPGKNLVYEHAENFPIQWAAEWGVPVTVVALLALAWCLRPLLGLRTLRSPLRRCALIGCAVLLLQNLADLALEIPAVAALLCCVLGALLGSAQGDAEAAEQVVGRDVLLAGSALTLACLGLALAFGANSPARLRRELFDQLAANSGPPPAEFWKDLERAVRAFPAESYFPLLGSAAALSAGSNPLPWISRALERNPDSAPAHLQLARILRARGATSQALGALRQAIQMDPELAQSVPNLAREWKLGLAEFEDAAPLNSAGAPLLLLLADRTQNIPLRLHLLEAALAHDPRAADAHYRIGWELLQEVTHAGLACAHQRDSCLTRVAEHARQASALGDSRSVVLEAWLLAETGQPAKAEVHLAEGCLQFPGDVKCLGAWVARTLQNDSPHLQDAVNALVAAGCSSPEGCASTHLGIGTLFANAGRWHNALSHFEHATQESPSTEAWQAVAEAAERLGDDMMAADARRRVALLAQGHARAEAAAPSERKLDPKQSTLPGPLSGD
jgi:tetratricopeptide (TPR) repeat protein